MPRTYVVSRAVRRGSAMAVALMVFLGPVAASPANADSGNASAPGGSDLAPGNLLVSRSAY